MCLWHLSADQEPLHVADFPGPSWQEAVRKHSHSGRVRDKHTEGGEKASSSSSPSVPAHTFLSAPALVCETLGNQEDRETSRRKEGGGKECVYSPEQHGHKRSSSDRPSLTLRRLNRQEMRRHREENDVKVAT